VTRIKPYPVGAKVPITVERHGRRQSIIVTLDAPIRNEYSIVPLLSATAEQVAIQKAWLAQQ
jgi:predicted metalloprotease with PDZ domain